MNETNETIILTQILLPVLLLSQLLASALLKLLEVVLPRLFVAAVKSHHVTLVVDILVVDCSMRDKGCDMYGCGGVGMPALAFVLTHGGGWCVVSIFCVRGCA